MTEVKIRLQQTDQVKKLVDFLTPCPYEVNLVSGRYTIDACCTQAAAREVPARHLQPRPEQSADARHLLGRLRRPAPAAPRAPPRLPRSVNPLPSLSFPYTARLVLSPSSEPGGFLLRKRSARATIEAENRSRRAKGAAYVEIIQRKKSGADRPRRGASISVYFYQQSAFSCSTHFMKVRCATPS